MLSCRDVAFIIPDEDWSTRQRFQLKLHMLICAKCRKLEKQLMVVEKGLMRIIDQAPTLPPELAHKIAQNYIESN